MPTQPLFSIPEHQRWGDENNTRARERRKAGGGSMVLVSGVPVWGDVTTVMECQEWSRANTVTVSHRHNLGPIETCAHGNAETWHLQTTHCLHPVSGWWGWLTGYKMDQTLGCILYCGHRHELDFSVVAPLSFNLLENEFDVALSTILLKA